MTSLRQCRMIDICCVILSRFRFHPEPLRLKNGPLFNSYVSARGWARQMLNQGLASFAKSKPVGRRGRKATGQKTHLTAGLPGGGSAAFQNGFAPPDSGYRRRVPGSPCDGDIRESGRPRRFVDSAHHERRWNRADGSRLVQGLLRNHEFPVPRLDVHFRRIADRKPQPWSDGDRYAHRTHDRHAVLRGRHGRGRGG